MGVYKRGKSWSVDYYQHNRRKRKAGFRTKSDAENFLKGIKYDSLFKNNPLPREDKISFIQLAKKYLEQHSKPNKKSHQSDISQMKKLVRYFGDFYIKDISINDIDLYKVSRKSQITKRGRPVSDTTINREMALIRNMMNKAVEWRMLANNPIRSIKMFKEYPKERILTEKELSQLVANAEGDLKHILIVAINTGMRKGEILNLRWSSINLEEKTIQTRSKTKKFRIIALNSALVKLFKDLNEKREDEIFVFENPNTGKPYKEIKRGWKTLLNNLKIEDFRFHDLRHCYATYKLLHGTNLRLLQDILGHTQITTTARYAKGLIEDQRRQVNNFCIGDEE